MTDPMRQKLEELKELRMKNYITEEEYAAARGNILLEAGFDVMPRTDPDARYAYAPPRREGRKKKKEGCGCFFSLLLLIIILLGGIFALPEDIVKLPGLNLIFGNERIQEARQTLYRFIDDLTGRPNAQGPSPSEVLKGGAHTDPTVAVPSSGALSEELGTGIRNFSGQGEAVPSAKDGFPEESGDKEDDPASSDS